eukprot:1108033_1
MSMENTHEGDLNYYFLERDVFANWFSNLTIFFLSVALLLLSPLYVVYYSLLILFCCSLVIIALYHLFKLPSPSPSTVLNYRQFFCSSIFGHRGCVKIESIDEGTDAAFQYAYEAEAHGIECDIRMSKDGHPVIIHQYHIKDLCNAETQKEKLNLSSLNIHQLTLKELKEIRLMRGDDAQFMSLYELVHFMNEHKYRKHTERKEYFCLLLEFKHCVNGYSASDFEKIMNILNVMDMMKERVVFVSFSMTAIYRWRSMYKDIHCGLIFERHMWYNWITRDLNIVSWKHWVLYRFLDPIHTFVSRWIFPYFCGCICVIVDQSLLSPFIIQHYKNNSLYPICWGAKKEVDIKWLLSKRVCCIVDDP